VVFNRPYAGPPDIPADRIKILREAFEKSWRDPELVKQAEKIGLPINYIGHEQAVKLVKSALKQPPAVIKLLREAYGVKD
jgi:tripartite-type tricarboxylate transporter receptor subunit TctC